VGCLIIIVFFLWLEFLQRKQIFELCKIGEIDSHALDQL
jgi:hypothetical protein